MNTINREKFIFLLVFGIRLLSIFTVQTFFVPDEYWQSLEVAHKLTFGYGYLTWEWEKQIRSSIYPLIISIIYSVSPGSSKILIHVPRVFQALLSAVGDFYTYKLASKLFGYQCGQWTAFNVCSSWFLLYCSPRTLANMIETSISASGLYLYPWKKEKNKKLSCKYLWFAGASVLIRPTCIVLWIPLIINHIWKEKYLFHFIKRAFLIGVIILFVQLFCDRWFYGQWTLTLYNFFIFNWRKDIGVFYGSHHFLWYLVIGFPVVLTILYIPFLIGLTIQKLMPLYILVLWFVLIFSIPSHKEFRFLLPILPVCMILSGAVLAEISSGRMTFFKRKLSKKISLYLAYATLAINIPLSIYMCLFHQRGAIDIIQHLSNTVSDNSQVLFLMPCHSTPYFSHLHKNITMKFLTCEPNFKNSIDHIEEADEFFSNPMKWLSSNYEMQEKVTMPTHIAMFDTLYSKVSTFLERHKYYLCFRTFHSHVSESRRGKYILLYCKS